MMVSWIQHVEHLDMLVGSLFLDNTVNTIASNITITVTNILNCFSAPEVLKQQPYGPPVDCWSIGVIAYIL